VQKRPCCSAAVPVDPGFIPWCDHCGWNVAPLQVNPDRNRFEQLSASLGQSLGRGLFEQLRREGNLRPGVTASRLAAFVLAGLVNLVPLGFWLLGLAFLIVG
jgi:hypothetical protein